MQEPSGTERHNTANTDNVFRNGCMVQWMIYSSKTDKFVDETDTGVWWRTTRRSCHKERVLSLFNYFNCIEFCLFKINVDNQHVNNHLYRINYEATNVVLNPIIRRWPLCHTKQEWTNIKKWRCCWLSLAHTYYDVFYQWPTALRLTYDNKIVMVVVPTPRCQESRLLYDKGANTIRLSTITWRFR